jgi:2-desacetyl-2-hydroxyethyl bacteriochlorophyllide A dehydrogenase
MRRLVFHGAHSLSVETAPDRGLAVGEVRLSPVAVGICGSDVHGYQGISGRRQPGMVMGHEAVGRVLDGAPGLAPGELVAVNPVVACGVCDRCRAGRDNLCAERRLYGCVPGLDGAFADRMTVRADNLVPLRGPAPAEWGALAEPFAVGEHAARRARIDAGTRVLIVGGGPIGIGAALAALRRAASVTVSEPDPHRRSVLSALDISSVAPEDAAAGEADVALECVGLPATVAAALAGVRAGGAVVMVGIAEPLVAVPVAPLVMEERALIGSAVYTRADFTATAAWIDAGTVDLAPVIERRVTLDELPAAFAAYAAGEERATKTVMTGAPA